MTINIGGISSSGGGGFQLGASQNVFTGLDRTAAETARDVYAGANPAWLAGYDADNNLVIRLEFEVGGNPQVTYQSRNANSQWSDNQTVTGIKGDSGSNTTDATKSLHGIFDITEDLITINADTTKFDVAAFDYYLNGTKYSFAGQTGISSGFTNGDNFLIVNVDATGIVLLAKDTFNTPTNLATALELGGLGTDDGINISFVGQSHFDRDTLDRDTYRWAKFAKGTDYIGTAGSVSPSVTPLQLSIAGGSIVDPDMKLETITGQANLSAKPYYHVGGVWDFQPTVTPLVVSNTQYDNGTGLTTISNNKWVSHNILRSSRTNAIYYVPSQAEYATKADAIDAPVSLGGFEGQIGTDVSPLAKIIVQQGVGSISEVIDVRNQATNIVSASTSTLQTTYDRSVTPEIVTSATGGALTVQGGTGTDTDNVYEGKDNAGNTTFAVQASGDVGIGTGSPSTSSKLTVSGTAGVNNVGILLEDTASATNYALYTAGNKFNVFNTNLTTDVMTVDGGNVGIGIKDPKGALQVNHTTDVNLLVKGENQLTGAVSINAVTDNDGFNIPLEIRSTKTAFTNGNVLIGTSIDDGAKLRVEIDNNTNLPVADFKNIAGTGTDRDAYIRLQLSTDNYSVGHHASTNTFQICNAPNLDTNSRLAINSSGDVLLGTTTSSGIGAKRLELKSGADAETTNLLVNTFNRGYWGVYQASDYNSYMYRTQDRELRIGRADIDTNNFNYDLVINADGDTLVGANTELPNATTDHVLQTNGFLLHKQGWRDLVAPFTTASAGGAAPTLVTLANGVRLNRFGTGDSMHVSYHVDHDYAEGTLAYHHVHWFPETAMTAGETVTWRVSYVVARGHDQGESLLATRTVFDVTYTSPAGGTVAGGHIVSEASLAQAYDLLEPDTVILAEIELLSKTTAANIIGVQADLHYLSDREATIGKRPDFNVPD